MCIDNRTPLFRLWKVRKEGLVKSKEEPWYKNHIQASTLSRHFGPWVLSLPCDSVFSLIRITYTKCCHGNQLSQTKRKISEKKNDILPVLESLNISWLHASCVNSVLFLNLSKLDFLCQ
jgi:hypothetical protein